MPRKKRHDMSGGTGREPEPGDAGERSPRGAEPGSGPLDVEQVDLAFRHGFDSRDRFAERPFHEVETLLRESWEGMDTGVEWADVRDIVGSGYERYKGAGIEGTVDPGPESLSRFPDRTVGGSATGGTMGESKFTG